MAPFRVRLASASVFAILVLCFPFQLSAQNPNTCTWTCPSHDHNGKNLVASQSEFPPFTSPYSVFSCVYTPHGPLSLDMPCRYYKTSGEYALGSTMSDCPASAAQMCTAGDTSVAARATHTAEIMPWMERGSYSLSLWGHHTRRDLSSDIYSMMCA